MRVLGRFTLDAPDIYAESSTDPICQHEQARHAGSEKRRLNRQRHIRREARNERRDASIDN